MVSFVLVLATHSSLINASFLEGKIAYQKKDYKEAELIWQKVAAEGDVRAQFYLATLYDQGSKQVKKNNNAAFKWYEQAAIQGHSTAQYNLGNAYKHGRGIIKSEDLASYWWRKAADNNSAYAQFNLAIQYYRGLGVEKSWALAVRYFNLAAENGHQQAQELISSGKVPAQKAFDSQKTTADTEQNAEVDGSIEVDLPDPFDWLTKQNPQHFTIQLAVTVSKVGIRPFLSKYQLEKKVNIISLERENKTVNYIFLGSYFSRQKAQLVFDKMSPGLKAEQPWIRSFGDLQKQLINR